MLPSNGTCVMLIEFCVWITPPITTVPPSVTSTCVVACCVINSGLPLNFFEPKFGRGVFHVDVQEDRVFGRDLRSHCQPKKRIYVGYGRRTTQLRLRHDRHAHTLFYQGLARSCGATTSLRTEPSTSKQARRPGHGQLRHRAQIGTASLALKNVRPLVGACRSPSSKTVESERTPIGVEPLLVPGTVDVSRSQAANRCWR